MDRRHFLQNLAVATASVKYLAGAESASASEAELLKSLAQGAAKRHEGGAAAPDVEGHTQLCEFKVDPKSWISWKVYEDLRTRDGVITFISSDGHGRHAFRKAPRLRLWIRRHRPISG